MSLPATADVLDPSGAELAAALFEFERLADAAYGAAGRLAVASSRARVAHNISTVAVHPIVSAFDRAASSIVEALGHAKAGHKLVERLGQSLNIPTAYGDGAKDQGDQSQVFTGA